MFRATSLIVSASRLSGTAGRSGLVVLPLVLLGLTAVLLSGCGGGSSGDEGATLALVGEVEITTATYEKRLASTDDADLPRDDQGRVLDTATAAGKEAFLQKLVDDQVMAQTALNLGYGSNPEIVKARESLVAYHAGLAMWDDEINEPASFVSNEQFDEYYGQMGSIRTVRMLVADTEADALAAREMALDHADWQEVVERYHTGQVDESGAYRLDIPFGQFKAEIEDAVYGVELGEITAPVLTGYGWFLARVENERPGRKPPVEMARADILDHIRRRNVRRMQAEIRERVHTTFGFRIEDSALQTVYAGLPATVADQRSRPGEQLQPLQVATRAMEEPLYGYRTPEGEERSYTVGDFKLSFDRMSGQQRPTREGGVAGLRSFISGEIDRALYKFEAARQGYLENPDVLFRVEAEIEQMLVSKLQSETVNFERRISPAELDSFWALHKADFDVPETRTGRLVVALTEEMAVQAIGELERGAAWEAVVQRFCSDPANRERQGRMRPHGADETGPLKTALFGLEVGQLSTVTPLEKGFAVVRLDEIRPPFSPELNQAAEQAGQRMRRDRRQRALDALLAKWRDSIPVEMFPENLAEVASWNEIHESEIPDNVVPRYIPRP